MYIYIYVKMLKNIFTKLTQFLAKLMLTHKNNGIFNAMIFTLPPRNYDLNSTKILYFVQQSQLKIK